MFITVLAFLGSKFIADLLAKRSLFINDALKSLFCFLCFLEHIFVLDGPDDFLIKRAQELPESDAEKMLYTQEEFVSRLKRYRQLSACYDSVVDYFDELEIHPEHIGTVLKVTRFIQPKKNGNCSLYKLEGEKL